ncbi:MAG: hypothetical protein LUD18_07395, partial [Lachnospiraceae bacterium]|nr:hypothetical protein [Lachnospiraceae bacterium]
EFHLYPRVVEFKFSFHLLPFSSRFHFSVIAISSEICYNSAKNKPEISPGVYAFFPIISVFMHFLARKICHSQQIVIQRQLAAPVLAYFTQDVAGRKEQVRWL